jgi:hypothetical protein
VSISSAVSASPMAAIKSVRMTAKDSPPSMLASHAESSRACRTLMSFFMIPEPHRARHAAVSAAPIREWLMKATCLPYPMRQPI